MAKILLCIFLIVVVISAGIVIGQNLDLQLLKAINFSNQPIYNFTEPVISQNWFAGLLGLSSMPFEPIKTIVAAGLTFTEVTIIKNTFKRPRPFETLSWVKQRAKASGYSMPSGHAAMAFESAYLWSKIFPRMSLLFYSVATYVALSRVYYGVHYPSDVLVGAVIGYITAKLTYEFLKPYRSSHDVTVGFSKCF